MDPVQPYPVVSEAVAALLDELEDAGLGRWRFGALAAPETAALQQATVYIILPEGNRLCALTHEPDADAETPSREQLQRVVRAGRVIGSLLATSFRAADLG